MTFYRPGYNRSQLQFRLDNERVPGNHVLMLEDPLYRDVVDQWSEPVIDGPQIDRVFRFDLTESDAIVIDA
jgi:hypothetical protein